MVVSEQGNAFPFAKWTCYGNGLQSAMIVRWPGKVKPGSVTDALVEYVDVTPTFVEAAGGTPAAALEGRSLLPLLTGETDRHKDHVYGVMTTRGIINGSDSYPIRTVRDRRYRLIWNLASGTKFTNACTRSPHFRSMVAAADAGDATAGRLVARYQHRPELELFDCDSDPLEVKNLAGDPRHEEVVRRLQGKLREWMAAQGDRGLQTEVDAIFRLRKNAGKTRDEVLEAWRQKGGRRVKRKQARRSASRTDPDR